MDTHNASFFPSVDSVPYKFLQNNEFVLPQKYDHLHKTCKIICFHLKSMATHECTQKTSEFGS